MNNEMKIKSVSLHWNIEANFDNCLLREFLRQEKEISRQALTDIKNRGQLLLNGEIVTVRAMLKKGDLVTVVFPQEERSATMHPVQIPLDIIYEDEHLLVINKQANLPTIPSIYHPNTSLANAVLYYYDCHNIYSTFHAVNRLDRDTSGLLIIAKHRYAHDLLTKQQRSKQVKRTYIAIVHGRIDRESGTIDAPIGRKETSIIEREVRDDGQKAITHYKVIKASKEETVVQLSLDTGRTHQIRVHMSFLGHPLLGDDLYGGKKTKIKRQALHSWKLEFFHPILKKSINFIVEPPEDMSTFLNG